MMNTEKFQHFLEIGRRISAEYKAQYKGVYYMKGGFLGEVLSNPITQILSDVVATVTGNPELIPLINGGERAAGGLVKGESPGKAFGQGAISGLESFAGSELAGAAANAFPETGAALGLDTSGNSLTDLAGSTSGAGSFFGPGTIGGDISNMFSGSSGTSLVPSAASPSGTASDSLGGTSNAGASGTTSAGVNAPLSAGTAPGGNAASTASSLGASAPLDTSGIDDFLQGQGSLYPTSVGAGGTPQLSSGTNSFLQSLSAQQAPTDALSPNVISASNAATPSGTDASLNQPGFLQNLTGGTADIAQANPATSSGPSAGGAAASGSKGLLDMLKSNPVALVSAAGLGLNAIEGNKPVKGENQLNAAAATDTANGAQLQSYLTSGQLPPGAQASINSAAKSQKAAIKSRFAQMGSAGSSAEQQELAAVDQWAQGQGSQLALQLLNSGINQSQLGAALYNDIAKNALSQDQSLASSIGNFAASLGSSHATAAA